MKNKFLRILLYLFGGLVFLFLVFNIMFSYMVNKKVPDLLANNDSGYVITYKELDVSIFSRNVALKDIRVKPIDSLNTNKHGVFAEIDAIHLSGIGLLNLVTSNKISVSKLQLTEPTLHLYPFVKKDSTEVKKEFEKIVLLDELEIISANAFLYKKDQKNPHLSVSNLDFNLKNIKLDKSTLKENLPLHYSDYQIKLDSLAFKANSFYTIKTNAIAINNRKFTVTDFKLLPNFNRTQFIKELPKEADMFTVLINKIEADSLDFGFKNSDLFVNISKLDIANLNADIYRNKGLPDDTSIKPLYSKMLRELPFYLYIKQTEIRNSNIVYNEEFDFNQGVGKVEFSNFNAEILNIASGFNQKKLADVVIHVKTKFYKVADLVVDWSFDILDKTDRFKIKGKLTNLPAASVDKFIKPTFNIEVRGTFKSLFFNYAGNSVGANGDFAVDYEDLEITVLKKDSRKKNKLLTTVGNLFVKKESVEKKHEAQVSFDRLQDKGFFNLLWKTTAEGLKQTLLII